MIIGRPTELNNDHYFVKYINHTTGEDLMDALEEIGNATFRIIDTLSEAQADYAYAPNKWTIKQVLRHITDAERVFAYRAFRFSRKDSTPLPGFSENGYANNDFSSALSLKKIRKEFITVRKATISLYATMDPEVLDFEGIASGLPMTPRILGWTNVGHNVHHLNVLRDRYLSTNV